MVTSGAREGLNAVLARSDRDLTLEHDHFGVLGRSFGRSADPHVDLGTLDAGIDVGSADGKRAPNLAQEVDRALQKVDDAAAWLRRRLEPADRVLVQSQRGIGADEVDRGAAVGANGDGLARADDGIRQLACGWPSVHFDLADHRDEMGDGWSRLAVDAEAGLVCPAFKWLPGEQCERGKAQPPQGSCFQLSHGPARGGAWGHGAPARFGLK